MGTCTRRVLAVSTAATLALVTACGTGSASSDDGTGSASSEEAWPTDPVSLVIPTAAGGGLDTTFRQLQPFIEEELGVPVAVEYREGGQYAIGTTYVANEGADCDPFMFHAIPDVIFSFLTQDVGYTYDDFYPIAGLTTEPSTFWVQNGASWESLEDLLDEARSRPGEISVSVANLTNADHLAVLNLQEVADVEFNIISYDGGGPARNALLAGEVDVATGGVFSSQAIASESRALAVAQPENLWPELTDDAPTVNEVLGSDIPAIGGSYAIFADKECQEEYPERFDQLVSAVEAAANSEGFQVVLEEAGESGKLQYQAPEDYDEFVRTQIDEITTLLEERPELFGL